MAWIALVATRGPVTLGVRVQIKRSGICMSGEKTYKQHYACFRCRKAFKKTNSREVPKRRLETDVHGRIVHCPQCGERMPDVGFDFEAPKQHDIKAWAEAEVRLTSSIAHAIRNSAIVNLKSRRRLKKLLKNMTRRIGLELLLAPGQLREREEFPDPSAEA